MGMYYCVKDFEYHDQAGKPFQARAGKWVDVLTGDDLKNLRMRGCVVSREDLRKRKKGFGVSVGRSVVMRVGIWLFTSHNYSGGRIHLYQYAWNLADLGAEVFLVTNDYPAWAKDYPPQERLHLIIDGRSDVPADIDLIVTDSKDNLGSQAWLYKTQHPDVPFVCMNFETPNWVEAMGLPDYAQKLQGDYSLFQKADYLLANSKESKKWLGEWLKTATACGVIQPAVNTYALQKAREGHHQFKSPKRPYVVWSARSPSYKGGRVAMEAVWACPYPLDLVSFGRPEDPPHDTELHKLHLMSGQGDAEKFAAMLGARAVLAPSLFEGFGMVPGEALACERPCIVYDLPVLRQEYGDALVYVDKGDKGKFSDAVRDTCGGLSLSPQVFPRPAAEVYGMEAMKPRIESAKFHAVKKLRVGAQLIAYWGFIPEALESIYPYVDEIAIAFGRTSHADDMDDGSIQAIRDFPDPLQKIRLEVRPFWKDKEDMRRWCTSNLDCNYHILLDGDEVWTGLEEWFKAGPLSFGCPRWINFWHSTAYWIHGGHWGDRQTVGGSHCPHYRCSRWRKSFWFKKHPMPYDAGDNPLHDQVTARESTEKVPGAAIYHFGHMLPRKVMSAKHEFYLKRDGRSAGNIQRNQAWLEWRGQVGGCGDGTVEATTWELPEIVQRAARRLQQ